MLKRKAYEALLAWKDKRRQEKVTKSLLVKGARQVGKTFDTGAECHIQKINDSGHDQNEHEHHGGILDQILAVEPGQFLDLANHFLQVCFELEAL